MNFIADRLGLSFVGFCLFGLSSSTFQCHFAPGKDQFYPFDVVTITFFLTLR